MKDTYIFIVCESSLGMTKFKSFYYYSHICNDDFKVELGGSIILT